MSLVITIELNEIVQKMKDKDFAGYCVPGCGSLLGLRLLQYLGKFILVASPATIGTSHVNLPNAAAAASALARATNELTVAYADDGATDLNALISACGRDKFVYICCVAHSGYPLEKHLKSVAPYARYSATASVAYAEDFLEKLAKAVSFEGVRYIELLAPCPSLGFDASNTVEIARLATECALFPLYEVENKKITVTKRPLRLEPVSRYYAAVKKQIKEEELQKIQDKANRNWKSLLEGRLL